MMPQEGKNRKRNILRSKKNKHPAGACGRGTVKIAKVWQRKQRVVGALATEQQSRA